ncbi:MAG TPA: hypothetical protein VEZ11_11105 [Thermoanaerobaculia bacterium]|nr:hypothetical protein [Thermoanaerobaculia bacterium]
MSRLIRLLIPLTSIAACIAVALLIAPNRAIGNERVVAPRAPSPEDRYVFGQNLVIDRPVKGDVQVWFGSIDVRDVIEGDLLAVGAIRFSGRGHVTGNVIAAGGRVENEEGRVGGRLVTPGSLEGAMSMLTQTNSSRVFKLVAIAVKLSLLFCWLIAALALTMASGREVRFSSIEIRTSALHCFTLGLVALTSLILTAIVFSFLVPYLVGLPLLVFLGAFAILTKVYGMVAVFHAVGTLVAGSRTREQLARRKWLRGDLAMVAIGVLVLGVIRMIPVAGTIVWALASVLGVGVALATKFGRREPWFLAWRPAEA